MGTSRRNLQGWVPRIGGEVTLERVVDLAFEYRGDVTLDTTDGGEITGYLYNRNASAADPFVQLFERETGEQMTLRYSELRNVRFTGRDMAAGQSYQAWKARRDAGLTN